MAASDGDRADASGRGRTGSLAVHHHADHHRVLHCRRKRDPPSPAVPMDGVGPPYFRPNRDLVIAIRHVARDHPRRDPAGVIPLCLIIGDSTALGTAGALFAQGVRCAVHARIGAPSAELARVFHSVSGVDRVLIAIGSNDPTNPGLARNLKIIRQRAVVSRVTWLAPYHAGAAKIVTEIARTLGDSAIQLSAFPSRDRVHPNSYRTVATALQWQTPASVRWQHRAARSPQTPKRGQSIRQAVVLSF